MPYIKKENRERLDVPLNQLCIEIKKQCTPGELNYIITMLCRQYLESRGKNYTHINDIIGVLECCKKEFYRRIVGPYEDIKIIENGDCY